MLRRSSLATLFGLAASTGCSSPSTLQGVGLDTQAYPAGVITTARVDWSQGDSRSISLHAGYNATKRDDFGEHDDESGGGPGLGVSLRKYWGENHAGWFAGGRVDLWFLEIDWEDGPASTGQTDAVVLQPTALGGYRWKLGNSPWHLDLYGAGGAEINVSTSGEDVGEGAIGLVGLALTYGF